jgi:hypothetical protein
VAINVIEQRGVKCWRTNEQTINQTHLSEVVDRCWRWTKFTVIATSSLLAKTDISLIKPPETLQTQRKSGTAT